MPLKFLAGLVFFLVISPANLLAASSRTDTPASGITFWLGGESYPCKPTVRQEVFEFTEAPSIRALGKDRYEITFAVKAACDATVGIVRKSDGKILRHLVSGVLGPNAPSPFVGAAPRGRPESSGEQAPGGHAGPPLRQVLAWDGKDDQHHYIPNPQACEVRVSLGLKPSFAGIYGWHPKDNTGVIAGLGAGPEGVFVLEGERRPQVRRFDHQGKYVRTVFPPPASVPIEALKGMPTIDLPDGGRAIRVQGYGALLPEWYGTLPQQTMAVSNGRLAFTSEGTRVPKMLYRMSIATGGGFDDDLVVALNDGKKVGLTDGQHLAPSVAGKWIYASGVVGLRGNEHVPRHAVYRFPFDKAGPLPDITFFGEALTAGKDNEHLDRPRGIACDAQGRVYVADSGNNRIAVFSPDAKFLKAIPHPECADVAVHHRSGEIYVLSFTYGRNRESVSQWRLTKLRGFDDPTVVATLEYSPTTYRWPRHNVPMFCLDSWADPPTVWLTKENASIVLLADRGTKFEEVADFRREVAATGLVPGSVYGGRMPKVVADPVRPHVYYHPDGWGNAKPYRFDVESGKCEQVQLPSPADDIAFDPQGNLYCRAYRALSRHDAVTMREIPFDYGEIARFGARVLTGAIPLKDMPGAKCFQDGFGVGADGRIAVVSNIFSWREQKFQTDYVAQLTKDQFTSIFTRLPLTPGRNLDNQGTVWVYDSGGQLIAEDVLKGPISGTIGAGIDRDGNVYVAANMTKVVEGKPFLPQYPTGTLIKAPLNGARVLGTWGSPPLDPIPDRSPDFRLFGPSKALYAGPGGPTWRAMALVDFLQGKVPGTPLWQTGLLWAYPGVSEIVPSTGACTCPTTRFSLDWYARSFVPECYRYSVAVVDANGNLVTHIGRYGNADNGRGPDSPVKVGGDEVAFSFPSFVSAIDGWLFVSDAGSDRIVRVKLGYHKEAGAAIP